LPKSSKNLDNFITFFLEIWEIYFEICQKIVPCDHVSWEFFNNKIMNFHHKKKNYSCGEVKLFSQQLLLVNVAINGGLMSQFAI